MEKGSIHIDLVIIHPFKKYFVKLHFDSTNMDSEIEQMEFFVVIGLVVVGDQAKEKYVCFR
jgi:hypothetical protein